MERSPTAGDEDSCARPGAAARGRPRGRVPALPVAGPAEARMQLDRQLALCRRQRTVLSVVVVVVDHVEADGGAPVAGAAGVVGELHDEVAHRMRSRVRSTDGVMRPGERETCAVLCGGTLDTARRVADRYFAALNGAYRLATGRAEVRVRIGYAAYPQDGVRASELLQRADDRLRD